MVPALYAASCRRSARRHLARHRRLRASVRRRSRNFATISSRGWPASAFRRAPPLPPASAAASAAARFGDGGNHPNRMMSAIRSRPCRSPRCGCRATPSRRWRGVGLKRIGDILDLPRAPLAARFGTDLLRMLDRALGRERRAADVRACRSRPISPKRTFTNRSRAKQDVLATVERLADAAQDGAGGARRRRPPRRACPVPHRRRGQAHRRRHLAPGARSASDPRALRRAARRARRRDRSGLRLRSGAAFRAHAEPCPDEQIGLGGSEDQAELDRLVDRLSARLGRRRVSRLVAHDSHIPELAAAALPAQATARAELGWDAFRRFRVQAGR